MRKQVYAPNERTKVNLRKRLTDSVVKNPSVKQETWVKSLV